MASTPHRLLPLALAASLGCGRPREDPATAQAFVSAADVAVGTQVPLTRIVPGQWDTLWVFGPYSVVPSLDVDHAAVRAAKRTSVVGDERANAVVLTEGRRVLAYAEVPRHLADFDLGSASRIAVPRTATLTVCRDTSRNRRVLVVTAAGRREGISCAPERNAQ